MNASDSFAAPRRRSRKAVVVFCLLAVAIAFWFWRDHGAADKKGRGNGPVVITSTRVELADVAVRLSASGQVAAVQSVDVRPQISATITAVHVKEGQMVRKGDRLFSLDVRNENAATGKAEAQLAKSRAELSNAERNLRRQQDLLAQKFVSPTVVDAAQNLADTWRAQVAADAAAVQAAQVPQSYGDIRAPIAGRTGAINVYPGSLVQPTGAALVSIAQIDPINVSFTIPERELPALRSAFALGAVPVKVSVGQGSPSAAPVSGQLSFIDNAVDATSGTIRLKASFANAEGRLWPGMFVTVDLVSRVMKQVPTVPVQAVQNGPESRFVYVVGDDHTVSAQRVEITLVQDGRAVIEGAPVGTRVVLEGAQNLRPGSTVSEAESAKTP